jgi:plastocyanin
MTMHGQELQDMQDNPTNGTGGRIPPHMRRLQLPVALTVALALLSACGGADDSSGEAASSEPAPAAVSEPASEPMTSEPAAEADATITGVDYAFQVGDVSAGDTIEFVNGSDKEAHEMVVMKVTDDSVTLEDIQELIAEDTEGPPPDFLEEAGFAFAMPGETAEQTVTLDQGRYLLLCFIPQNAPPDLVAQMMESSEEPEIPSEVEAELGPPHAAAGMVDLVDVE